MVHKKKIGAVMFPALFSVVLLLWSLFEMHYANLPIYLALGPGSLAFRQKVAFLVQCLYIPLNFLALANLYECCLTDNCPNSNPIKSIPYGAEITVPVCSKCGSPKPERCHHCRWCNACALRYDHHCPWVGNCVGFYNYKFFLNFKICTLGASLIALLTSLRALPFLFGRPAKGTFDGLHPYHALLHGYIALAFVICVAGMLGTHCLLIKRGETTIEARGCCVDNSDNEYDLGFTKNFLQIYGHRKLLWLLPVFTGTGDGWTYTKNTNLLSRV